MFPVFPSKSFPKSSIIKPPKTTRTSMLGAKYNLYVSKHKSGKFDHSLVTLSINHQGL